MKRDEDGAPEHSKAGAVELTKPEEIDADKKCVGHGLIDVLMPASPPQPKNARVIRLFSGEPGERDARPLGEPAPSSNQQQRHALKAARNQSLFAAAGFTRPGRVDAKSGG